MYMYVNAIYMLLTVVCVCTYLYTHGVCLESYWEVNEDICSVFLRLPHFSPRFLSQPFQSVGKSEHGRKRNTVPKKTRRGSILHANHLYYSRNKETSQQAQSAIYALRQEMKGGQGNYGCEKLNWRGKEINKERGRPRWQCNTESTADIHIKMPTIVTSYCIFRQADIAGMMRNAR